MGGGDAVNFTDPFGLCPKSWGGDGKDQALGNCPVGSSGYKEWIQQSSGAVADAGLADPYLLVGGVASGARALLGRALTGEVAGVTANKIAGDAFRDEIAGLFRAGGYGVRTEVGKLTPFGRRVIDIEVSRGGQVLGGIETKVGGSRYTSYQRAKDAALYILKDYPVQLVRKP